MSRHSAPPVPPNSDQAELARLWGATIDPELLDLAITHRSYAYEAGGIAHNERLEFLGDSVLSIVVADHLYHEFPDLPESDLSRMRAATVSQEPLAIVARSIGLGDFIRLGRGEGLTGGRDKDSILSDTVEALIGATYLSLGMEEARRVVLERLSGLLDHAVERGQTQDWKTILAEYARSQGADDPVYTVTGRGPDHSRTFAAAVAFGSGETVGAASESSKKHAENLAARDAMLRLDPDFIHHHD
ncbi:MAG TPA: ribonuclease III [Lacisediminihabitans sp.]|uniref:ribonuclease III n=1 Tax=Lacisediminihabitans sp. TaxID=2787631 RepID=UPI002ED77541